MVWGSDGVNGNLSGALGGFIRGQLMLYNILGGLGAHGGGLIQKSLPIILLHLI